MIKHKFLKRRQGNVTLYIHIWNFILYLVADLEGNCRVEQLNELVMRLRVILKKETN